MMELLIVKFLVMKITISNIVSEKRKLDDCDYLDRFLLRFHAVINMYSADFLDWEPVPEMIQCLLCCLPLQKNDRNTRAFG